MNPVIQRILSIPALRGRYDWKGKVPPELQIDSLDIGDDSPVRLKIAHRLAARRADWPKA
jgi:hypothetical protein